MSDGQNNDLGGSYLIGDQNGKAVELSDTDLASAGRTGNAAVETGLGFQSAEKRHNFVE